MRRVLSLIFATLFVVALSAQTTNSIIIKPQSFRAVNTDDLTGVAIDEIGLDHSLRPCARIKMKINRMTSEEIDGIQVMPITNNEVIRCQTAQYDNGLIIELTAKAPTRFYLRHNKFGDSNEVSIDLEGNKEYYIETELVQQFPITIATNVADAAIYIDNQFKGKSNEQFYLIVEDMLAGNYTLKLEYAGKQYIKEISVSSSSVYFKQEVDLRGASMQYLTVSVSPKNALVEIDNQPIETTNGKGKKLLSQGTYQYHISALKYYPQSGTVTMAGEKVELNIQLNPAFGHLAVQSNNEIAGAQVYVDNLKVGTLPLEKNIRLDSGEHKVKVIKSLYHPYEQLVNIADGKVTSIKPQLKANFAKVTLISNDNGEIWVDSELKGRGKWVGNLEIGQHEIECRNDSYHPQTTLLRVSNTESVEYTFKPLVPIYGTINIDCNIIGAQITIDGVQVGTTPLVKGDVLVGSRTVTISKEGYNTVSERVTVVENQTTSLTKKLTPKRSSGTTTTPSYSYNSATFNKQTSTTSANKKNSYRSRNNHNIVQFGLGFEYGFGDAHMSIGFPFEMRIGRSDQFFNFFVAERFGIKSMTKKESDTVHHPELSLIQMSTIGKFRFNVKRSISDASALFLDFGAMYNINTGASYKTGSISYSSSSYDSGMQSKTSYKADILQNSVSALFAIGYGGRLMEFSLYGIYDITPTFKHSELSNYIVEHSSSSSYPTTLSDYGRVNKFANCRYNIGFAVKIFFGSGYFK